MKLTEITKSHQLACGIPYAEVGGMLERISESGVDGRERAISFCGDGNELLFPGGLGKPYTVAVPECPPDKERIGTFHTHPQGEEFSEKSVGDWRNCFEFRDSVSCLGYQVTGSGGVKRKEIACHTIDVGHPEYEEFRDKILPIAHEGAVYGRELTRRYEEEKQEATDEEYDKYMSYRDAISDLMIEGRKKGIIKHCTPSILYERLRIPDVKAMLAEEKPPVIPKLTVVECDSRYSLSELKVKARASGISTSGDKKSLCSKLMAAGVLL